MGKTGAWLLMIRLLHDHLRSLQGVTVENLPLPLSLFLPSSSSLTHKQPNNQLSNSVESPVGSDQLQNHTHHNHHVCAHTAVSSSSKHSRIVSLEYLHDLLKSDDKDSKNSIKPSPTASPRDTPTRSLAESSSLSSSMPQTTGTGFAETRHVISISISPYMSYDFTHSCNECSKYVRGNIVVPPEILTFSLPVQSCHATSTGTGGERSVSIKWCIPTSQQKHAVIDGNRRTLERLKLPVMRVRGEKSPLLYPMTPVFTPTLGRDSSGLFNLFHHQYYHIHVLVTSESEFGKYCKAWPNHIIMALPDKVATGLGKEGIIHYIGPPRNDFQDP